MQLTRTRLSIAIAALVFAAACSSESPASHASAEPSPVGGSGERPTEVGVSPSGNADAPAVSNSLPSSASPTSVDVAPEETVDVPPIDVPRDPLDFPGDAMVELTDKIYGHGPQASGGLGGRQLMVTTLNGNGQGSLPWALGQTGSRTISFAVSGLLRLPSFEIKNGDVTLDGSSSPKPGVTITGSTLGIAANNVVLKYLRFRGLDKPNNDSISFNGGAMNVVLDHVSISWSTDYSLTTSKTGKIKNITVQNSLIAEPIPCLKGGGVAGAQWRTPEMLADGEAPHTTCD